MHDIDRTMGYGVELSGSLETPLEWEYTSEQPTLLGEIFTEALAAGGLESAFEDQQPLRPDVVVGGFKCDGWAMPISEKPKLILIAQMILSGSKSPVGLVGHTDPVG